MHAKHADSNRLADLSRRAGRRAADAMRRLPQSDRYAGLSATRLRESESGDRTRGAWAVNRTDPSACIRVHPLPSSAVDSFFLAVPCHKSTTRTDAGRHRSRPSRDRSMHNRSQSLCSGTKVPVTQATAIEQRLRRVVHQHDMQPARPMCPKFQRLLDVRRTRWPGHQHHIPRHAAQRLA